MTVNPGVEKTNVSGDFFACIDELARKLMPNILMCL